PGDHQGWHRARTEPPVPDPLPRLRGSRSRCPPRPCQDGSRGPCTPGPTGAAPRVWRDTPGTIRSHWPASAAAACSIPRARRRVGTSGRAPAAPGGPAHRGSDGTKPGLRRSVRRSVDLRCAQTATDTRGRRAPMSTPPTPARRLTPVATELSFLDRCLSVWLLAAMAIGLLLGRFIPGLARALDSVQIAGISVPIAVGLLVMMYPVLAKVRYDETHRVT